MYLCKEQTSQVSGNESKTAVNEGLQASSRWLPPHDLFFTHPLTSPSSFPLSIVEEWG